jgi:predicted aspartyl protease
MKNKIYSLVFLFIVILPSFIFAQKRYGYHMTNYQKKITIPFEVYNNLIILQIRMDGLPLRFILDTGVHHTILVKREYADIIGLQFDREVSLLGADKNQIMIAYVSNEVNMSFGNIVNERERLLVLEQDYLEFERLFGANVHGIVGFEIFRQFVIKINYTSKTITLYRKDKFKVPKKKKYQDYYISIENTKPYINMNVTLENEDTVQAKFLLDTGASFDLLLDINSSDKIDFPKNSITGDMGHGLGGALEGKIGRVDKLDFKPFALQKITTFYQNDTIFNELIEHNHRHGIIGGGVLSRFIVIFDYPNNLVYLKKNSKYKIPFYFNMSGIILADNNNYSKSHLIKKVLPNSPASEAGILPGDKIIKMGASGSPELTKILIKTEFKTKEGKKIKLTILRDGKTLIKYIKLRELI